MGAGGSWRPTSSAAHSHQGTVLAASDASLSSLRALRRCLARGGGAGRMSKGDGRTSATAVEVLIVDAFRRNEHGRKAWKHFEAAVRAAIASTSSAAHEVAPPDVACCTLAEVEERYCCDSALFDGLFSAPEAGRRFDATDLVFADGDDAGLLPWAPRARPLLVYLSFYVFEFRADAKKILKKQRRKGICSIQTKQNRP